MVTRPPDPRGSAKPAAPAREADRLLRPHPRPAIPQRTVTLPPAGLLAKTLLGARVVK